MLLPYYVPGNVSIFSIKFHGQTTAASIFHHHKINRAIDVTV